MVAYDPTWPERFEIEQRLLADALPTALSIEHIGSTSVPGLARSRWCWAGIASYRSRARRRTRPVR
ncbi:GrpB family protein [Streptomyces sp. SD15]